MRRKKMKQLLISNQINVNGMSCDHWEEVFLEISRNCLAEHINFLSEILGKRKGTSKF